MAEIKLTGVRDQDYDNRVAFADSALTGLESMA